MLGEQMDRSADSRPIACVEKLLNSDRSEYHLLPSSFCSEKKNHTRGSRLSLSRLQRLSLIFQLGLLVDLQVLLLAFTLFRDV